METDIIGPKIAEILKSRGCSRYGGDTCHCEEWKELNICERAVKAQITNEKPKTATISFNLPVNCVTCPLAHDNSTGRGIVCKAKRKDKGGFLVWQDAFINQHKRAEWCPLKVNKGL